jgi:hypothetical protein
MRAVDESIQGVLSVLQSSSCGGMYAHDHTQSVTASAIVTATATAAATLGDDDDDGGTTQTDHSCFTSTPTTPSASDSHDDATATASVRTLTLKSVGMDLALLRKSGFSPKHLRQGGFCALEALRAGGWACVHCCGPSPLLLCSVLLFNNLFVCNTDMLMYVYVLFTLQAAPSRSCEKAGFPCWKECLAGLHWRSCELARIRLL